MAISKIFPYRKPYTSLYEPFYDKTIERKKKIDLIMNREFIESLIIDKYFGIYTRNGFDYMMEGVTENCKFYLIDFDDIKGLNKKLGYLKVNDILKKTFAGLKEHYIIGRAFSGDEIFFLTYNLDDNIDRIKEVCLKNNLTFTYIEKKHYHMIKHTMGSYRISFHKIPDTLEEMINELH